MNIIEQKDIELIAEYPYKWDSLTNKTILISGGTGFIGSMVCDVIRYRNKKYNQNTKIICVSRFNRQNNETVSYIKADICDKLLIDLPINYIIHLASNTHPKQYKEDPVGTITTNVFGAYQLLMYAKSHPIEKFLLASSCEIYGEGEDYPVKESYCGYIDCNNARSGYNESKRLCESLCQSFLKQYNIPVCIFRLARVFGYDKTKNDTKALSQFFDNVSKGNDIVLKSFGLQKYSYIYIADAILGIFAVLFNGVIGEAYNISDDNNGMTLGDYANYIAKLGNKNVFINIENDDSVSKARNALLDNTKIKEIGFSPMFSVLEGLNRTFSIICEQNNIK